MSAGNEAQAMHRSTTETVAASGMSPAATAALEAGNAADFARAMGIEKPSEAFLAAANASGSPFDPRSSGPWTEATGPDKPASPSEK
jgi:hypothetical protein